MVSGTECAASAFGVGTCWGAGCRWRPPKVAHLDAPVQVAPQACGWLPSPAGGSPGPQVEMLAPTSSAFSWGAVNAGIADSSPEVKFSPDGLS